MYILIGLKIPSENNHGSCEFDATWIIAKDLPRERLPMSFNNSNGSHFQLGNLREERDLPFFFKKKWKLSDSHGKWN